MNPDRLGNVAAVLVAITSTISLLAYSVVATDATLNDSRPGAIAGIFPLATAVPTPSIPSAIPPAIPSAESPVMPSSQASSDTSMAPSADTSVSLEPSADPGPSVEPVPSSEPFSSAAPEPEPSATPTLEATAVPTSDAAPSPTANAQPEPTSTPEPTPTPVVTPLPPSGASTLVVTTPTLRFVKSSRVPMAGVPAVVSWGLVIGQHGLRRYDLQVQRDGGPFSPLGLISVRVTSRAVTLQAGHTFTYRVRAVDTAGHAGAWKSVGPGAGLDISDASSSITWQGPWTSIALRAYLGGSGHSTGAAGATATLRFSGTSVAWVGPMGPTRGKAQVFIDGHLVSTVDLWAASFHPRRIVFAASVPDGAHTLVIKALGTAGRSTVNVDSIYVIQPD